jgi:hypothetical protein
MNCPGFQASSQMLKSVLFSKIYLILISSSPWNIRPQELLCLLEFGFIINLAYMTCKELSQKLIAKRYKLIDVFIIQF